MRTHTTARRAGALTVLCGVALAVSATLAPAASAAGPVVTKETGTNGCNGVKATPGSENTSKTLVGGSMQPGEVAIFEIEYPIDADNVGDTFTITDCVFVDDAAVEKYSITFVPNNTAYTLEYAITIPDGTPIGAEYCNYAKTTAGPSDPQASNRKANPACFNVGGSLRVEKHDETGALLPGAEFTVECDPGEATVPPVVVDGLDEDGIATTGVIGINGPEGTECDVTEVTAPEGYELGEDPSQTLTIPRGSDSTTAVFVNMPASVETESPSPTPSESESPEPTVEPSDPEPTISPTVLGVKQTKAPEALPQTGAASVRMLALGLLLMVVGAALLLGGQRYQRQH